MYTQCSYSSTFNMQLSMLMRVLKNTLEGEPQRLPSLHTVFCAQVAHLFLQPGNVLSSLTTQCCFR